MALRSVVCALALLVRPCARDAASTGSLAPARRASLARRRTRAAPRTATSSFPSCRNMWRMTPRPRTPTPFATITRARSSPARRWASGCAFPSPSGTPSAVTAATPSARPPRCGARVRPCRAVGPHPRARSGRLRSRCGAARGPHAVLAVGLAGAEPDGARRGGDARQLRAAGTLSRAASPATAALTRLPRPAQDKLGVDYYCFHDRDIAPEVRGARRHAAIHARRRACGAATQSAASPRD